MTTATFASFIADQRAAAKKPNADIRSRWQSRIVARGLEKQGRAGANAYLRDYGKGISVAKVVAFAVLAEQEGFNDVAAGFWAGAFTLETGNQPTGDDVTAAGHSAPAASPSPSAMMKEQLRLNGLPDHLQPGRLITMQPVDAGHDREHYITSPAFIGQPKRDGNRMVIMAGETIAYQSRTLSAMASPGDALDRAFAAVATKRGTFVLDSEKTFLDCQGGEHRTGSQAAKANAELGKAKAPVVCLVAVFKALFADGIDLTTTHDVARIAAAKPIVEEAQRALALEEDQTLRIELVPTAITTKEKRELCRRQLTEGREGEVWIRRDTSYRGGKVADEMIVRTKYLTESTVIITGLTETTVRGRPFGALEVAERQSDGSLRPVGSVGTGFSLEDARDLAARHRAAPGTVTITVMHQGRTENGMLWHARYLDLV